MSRRFPKTPGDVPQVRSWWRRPFGIFGLWLMGWRIEGNFPSLRKFVVIVAPHTSNWDFVVGILTYFALRLDANWLAKHTALRGPWGPLGRYLGAVAVDRSQAGNVVQSSNVEFAKRESMMLVIAPEGTRGAVDGWKRGYHYIALAAGVPIVPVALDFGQRRVLIGEPLSPCNDYEADYAHLKSFFSAEMARHPENFR
ncbi:MAG: hypothetical protein RLZZ33_1117 [Pseudomonadota bacterium]